MALLQANKNHRFWGRKYPEYTASYTNEALSMSLMAPPSPKVTLETINKICELGGSQINTTVDRITLPLLTGLLSAIMEPQQLHLIAVPRLVSGCVNLMASIQPSALEYEYGYVCFCILVISLNACIMKHAGYLDQTIALMNNAAASQRLTAFWEASSCLICQISRGKQHIIPSELLDASMLGQLLRLLHRDKKLFLTVLKRTNSLGLSGLMFVFFKHLLITADRYKSPEDHFKDVIRPYSQIFWRYFIITPESEAEEAAIFDFHTRVALYSRLYYDKPVDAEDSINLIQALNDRLECPRPVSAMIVAARLRFVAPLVVSGCENLIPTTIKRCIQLLWDFLAVGYDAAYARQGVLNFLLYLRDMLMALKPPQFNDQPWIWEVVDHIINGDVLDLALRVFSTASSSSYDRSDMAGTEGQLFSATIEAYIALSELVPSRELMLRFFYAGCLGAWSKCYFYFRISGTENTFRDTFSESPTYSINWGCGEIVAGVLTILMGSKWDGFAWVGSCDNPRCAMPCYSPLIGAECVDMMYCGLNCAMVDWDASWRSPHRSVCKQQAQHTGEHPHERKHFHRHIDITLESHPYAADNSFSRSFINHIRSKWSKPKSSTLQGVMVKDDYRKPVEFQAHKFRL